MCDCPLRCGRCWLAQALQKVATKKGVSMAEVGSTIVAAGGPKSNGTRAEACRFYDDKSNWWVGAGKGVAGRPGGGAR